MRWKIVKVRFPKNLHRKLKSEAKRKRISFAALVRERLLGVNGGYSLK